MKFVAFFLAGLLPIAANAMVTLSNCDKQDYDVIIRSSGSEREVHMPAYGPPAYDYGPVVSFQIKDKDAKKQHRIVRSDNPFAEYCIWHGNIDIQRMNSFSNSGGGSLR